MTRPKPLSPQGFSISLVSVRFLVLRLDCLPGAYRKGWTVANGRISKRTVDALTCPPENDRVFLWDDVLSGFGVVAHRSGRRVYVVQYRRRGAGSARATIGEHGRLTAEEARAEAKKLLGYVAQGVDIAGKRRAERMVPTFKEVADAYLAKHVERHRKPRTAESYEGLLRLHILPKIGRLRITDVKRQHIEALLDALAEKPGAANRSQAVVNAIWTWAATKTYCDLGLPVSPAKGIERNREEGRERYLSTDELARLGDTLARAETIGLPYSVDETKPKAKHAPKPENRVRKIDPFAIAAIRLLIFTGARLREVLHARWDEIDFERGLLNLSSARSKTGKKALVLNAPALDILASLPRIAGNPHLMPGEGRDASGVGLPRVDLKAPWRAITAAAGIDGLRIHDLRHSHAATGAGLGLGLHMVGKLLGHSQPATTARYAHLDTDPLRRASDAIGTALDAAMKRVPGAEVVPLRPTRTSR